LFLMYGAVCSISSNWGIEALASDIRLRKKCELNYIFVNEVRSDIFS